ncbi:MAG: L,D-transpeptidase family protein [Pseudomonadota bacterium]
MFMILYRREAAEFFRKLSFCAAFFTLILGSMASADAFQTALQTRLKALNSSDSSIVAFYTERGLKPVWTGSKNRARRDGLIRSLKASVAHGLPAGTYKIAELQTALKSREASKAAAAEIMASQVFVDFGRDLNSGVIRPSSADREIAIRPQVLSSKSLLEYAAKTSPRKFIDGLKPQSSNYAALQKEQSKLIQLAERGRLGQTVPKAKKYEAGMSGAAIQILRNRLISLGYRAGTGALFDPALVAAVKKFQSDHDLNPDGVVGSSTLTLVNLSVDDRLRSVVVNMERERWLPQARGKRHIYVNIADARVTVYDGGRASFTSRTVVGKNAKDFRTPEFVDEMTHLVINPTWHVPASIAGREYLPILKTDPGYLGRQNMALLNQSGQSVSASSIDFSQYSEGNFPYFIKQRPDPGNALGQVKFIFPNQFNVYLHDTPSRSLFNRDYRAYSHGCIRVHKPVEFAHHLLAKQTNNPKGFYQAQVSTKREQYVGLKQPVPVYISYNTSFRNTSGEVTYRSDFYGRDKRVFNAMTKAGVRLQLQGS